MMKAFLFSVCFFSVCHFTENRETGHNKIDSFFRTNVNLLHLKMF